MSESLARNPSLEELSEAKASAIDDAPFLAGGGELGARMRSFNWSRTPLGPPQNWPRSLKTAVRIMLTSRQPIWIGWGPELIYLYNDPYKSIIGGKHPWALGRPVAEVWSEIWEDIGPMLATAMEGNEGIYVEEQLLIMERSGYPEETYYTFSYSPIPDDDGGVGGIICANTDDTRRVIGERQLALLREVAAATVDARTVERACEHSAHALATDARDLPFALLYLADPDNDRRLVLAGVSGIARDHPAAPQTLALGAPSLWPAATALDDHRAQLVRDLAARFGCDFPTGAWDEPPAQAAATRIPARGDTGRPGVLIAGLNPYRLFDDDYRRFLDLVASEIGAALANAQAYEDERRRAEALAEIDRAKTAFFSNISHEFRTPLALMLGPIEDALNDPQAARTPVQRERLDIVYRNALRLLRLVNTLLDFSRIEAGRVAARFEPTDLAALTAELASNFRSLTDRAGLALRLDCADLGAPVFIDRDMWEKIVLNLLSNAFKFTFDGEISVEIRSRGAMAELVVCDTGTGIAEHELPRLFERFHRIEGSEGRTFEGSGIGLALVQELVKQLGGSIRVESTLGKGSAFIVSVPFGTAHLPQGPVAPASSALAASSRADAFVQEALRWLPEAAGAEAVALDVLGDDGAAPGRGERILLADDNADMREYIRRLLIGKGYVVETAGDGVAALEAARRTRPDLVISDVMMPRLDGLGLLAAIREDPGLRTLPVVLLSARAGEEARIEGLDAGADDYVSKPFSARELLARVRANLQLADLRRQADTAQREQTVMLEATVRTVPTAVWYTHDPDATAIFGNDYAARLLRLPLNTAAPTTVRGGAVPFRAFRQGREAPRADLPLRRALRGETTENEELEIRFDDGAVTTIICQGAPIRDEQGNVVGAVCGALDITDRKRHEEHQHLLLNELNHRVKNTLAMVQSLTMQTLRSTSNMAEARDALVARLIALAKAHDVLTRENWEGAGLHDVVVEALAAHLSQAARRRLWFDGPELKLRPRASLALSMAFHELATNAVKYGALSVDEGRVDIAWMVDERGNSFALDWVESGGPTVRPPQKRGFGSRLVERGLAQDLGGSVQLAFKPGGIVCTIRAPLAEVQALTERQDIRQEKAEA